MGPRLLRRGDAPLNRCFRGGHRVLQWGRGCYAAETLRASSSSSESGLRLQWGRGCYAAETRGRRADARGTPRFNGAAAVTPRRRRLGRRDSRNPRRASMGPRLLRRGDWISRTSTGCPLRASMGPRLLRRGDSALGVNGRPAIQWLQWGRGCYAAETSRLRPFSIECSLLQWGRGCYAAETSSRRHRTARACPCFNGAAAVTPRRLGKTPLWSREQLRASMGPRLLRRGDRGRAASGRPARPRFNGAAAVTPRRPTSSSRHPSHSCVLQWGRGCYAAETLHEIDADGRPRLTLQWGRGCYAAETCVTNSSAWCSMFELQWGRGCYAAETPGACRSTRLPPSTLQWGRGCYAAETTRCCSSRTYAGSLQWGRGCYAAETAAQRRAIARKREKASMGPRLLRRGDHGQGQFLNSLELLLQWGRGCYAAETPYGRPTSAANRSCFNGAAAVTPRRPRSARASCAGQDCPGFNGAAAVTPRRPASAAGAHRRWYDPASMGPRLLRRGDQLRFKASRPLHFLASMGPRLLRRGDCAVRCVRKCETCPASMGPRLLRRGDRSGSLDCRTNPGSFNGAAAVTPRRLDARVLTP